MASLRKSSQKITCKNFSHKCFKRDVHKLIKDVMNTASRVVCNGTSVAVAHHASSDPSGPTPHWNHGNKALYTAKTMVLVCYD